MASVSSGENRLTGWLVAFGVLVGLALALMANKATFADSRPLQATWESGHILLFFGVVWRMGLWWRFRQLTTARQLVLLLLITIIAGSAIELLQGAMGRAGSPSLADMRRNLVGALAGLAFVYPLPWLHLRARRLLRLCTAAVILFEMTPVISLWQDDFVARRAFPSLSDFETTAQQQRWSRGEVIHFPGRGGVLQVPLVPARFSGSQMVVEPRDWSDYDTLVVWVFNPSPEAQQLQLSLRDRAAQERGAYDDRYNARRKISTGWNRLTFSLDEARRAPRDRELALDNLRQLNLFFEQPAFPFILLDDVHLTRTADQ